MEDHIQSVPLFAPAVSSTKTKYTLLTTVVEAPQSENNGSGPKSSINNSNKNTCKCLCNTCSTTITAGKQNKGSLFGICSTLGVIILLILFILDKLNVNKNNILSVTDILHRNNVDQVSNSGNSANPQEFIPDLVEFTFKSDTKAVDLVGDSGDLKITKSTNDVLEGSLLLNKNTGEQVSLSFMIDSNLKLVSFQREDVLNNNQVEQSFFSRKTADANQDDYYEFNGKALDVREFSVYLLVVILSSF